MPSHQQQISVKPELFGDIEDGCKAAWDANIFVRVTEKGITLCGDASVVSKYVDNLSKPQVEAEVEDDTEE